MSTSKEAHIVLSWMQRYQVWCYLAGLAAGAFIGLIAPAVTPVAENAVLPVLGVLLFATFLGIPMDKMGPAFRDSKFLSTVLVLNFVLVPIVVCGISRIVAHDDVVLVGVLFTLLTPCIDYVIVFAGLAGGDTHRLLVTAPILMIVQMLLLPLYLWAFLGAEFLGAVEFRPFVDAFLLIVLIPLLLALVIQKAAAYWRWARAWKAAAEALLVPLMVVTLATVVASQIGGVENQVHKLLGVIPVYMLFAVIMVPVGLVVGRAARLGVPQQRAVVFSGVTRNSLVILPLVLALPAHYDLAALVVVTQTLVELVVMVILVQLLPRLRIDAR